MSINIQGRTGWNSIPNAIGRSKLPHPTLHLLINLLSHADGFNATYSIITEQTGMSSKTIAAALGNLKKLGIISVNKVKGTNGRFESNDYDFHPDRLWTLNPEFVDERLRGKPAVGGKDGGLDRSTRESGTAVEGKAVPLYEGKTKKDQGERPGEKDHKDLSKPDGFNESDNRTKRKYPPEFDEWWFTYPKRTGSKWNAYTQFKAAVKRADLETLMDGARKLAAYVDAGHREAQFVKDAERWLKGDMWEEELVAPSPPHQRSQQSSKVENTLEAWGYTETGSTLPWEDPAPTFDDAPFIDAEVY